MILASDIITLVRVNDGAKGATGKGVKSNTRYYCLQASATKPSKPTTNPPDSKWTTTEPSYTTGSTSYLYTVDLTVYTDNNFLYSDVSLSSSYEAAKAAYAKAVNAETEISKTNEEVALKASKNEVTETLKGYATTASMNAAITTKANEITSSVAANYTTKNEFDNLRISGKNLLRGPGYLSAEYWGRDSSGATAIGSETQNINKEDDTGYVAVTNTNSNYRFGYKYLPSANKDTTFTISVKYKHISGSKNFMFQIQPVLNGSLTSSYAYTPEERILTDGWILMYKTFTVLHDCDSIRVWLRSGNDYELYTHEYYIKEPMLELSTIPSDWSPAPEDIGSRIASAETRITQTETDIKSKASQTELSGLTTRVSTAEQDISAANAAISQKAEKTELTGLTTRVSTAEENINAANAAISQKAEKTELTGLTTRVSTAEENINAANAQIQLKVSQAEFNNLQIGGQNLFRGAPGVPDAYWVGDTSGATTMGTVITTIDADSGEPLEREVTNTDSNFRFIYRGRPAAANGVTFTLSVKYRHISGVQAFTFQVQYMDANGSTAGYAAYTPEQRMLSNGWVLMYKTFTVPVVCASLWIALRSGEDYKTYTHTYRIKEPMLEYSSTPSEWSRAVEDKPVCVKNTTVTIDPTGMYVNTAGVIEFNTNKFEITPPDGGDQLFSVNASTKNLKAQNGYFTFLSAPNMASRPVDTNVITRNIGSGSGYYPNIQAAWDSLPDVCGYVIFNVCSNSPGSASLRNKYVSCLSIQSSPSTSKFNIGTVEFLGLSGTISNVTMSCNGGIYDDACRLIGSNFAFANVTFASSGRGLSIFYGGYACVSDCQISGIGNYAKPQNYAICVTNGFLSCNNTYGLGTAGGVYGQAGSLMALNGTCPGPSVVANGATVVGNYTVDGAAIDVPVVEKSSTFTASTWCTWECISRSLWKRITVNVSVQSRSWSGLNNKDQYPNGFCKRAGWWVLDTGSSIKDTLNGKTISKATVIINRTNTGEAYKLTLAYHGVTNCDLNGYSVSADYNIANQLISIGVYDISADSGQVIIDLPSSLYSKLQDGTIKGFGLLNNGTYFKDVYCDGTCTLNVTYT